MVAEGKEKCPRGDINVQGRKYTSMFTVQRVEYHYVTPCTPFILPET